MRLKISVSDGAKRRRPRHSCNRINCKWKRNLKSQTIPVFAKAKWGSGCLNAPTEMRKNLNNSLRKGHLRKCPNEQISSLPLTGNCYSSIDFKKLWKFWMTRALNRRPRSPSPHSSFRAQPPVLHMRTKKLVVIQCTNI